MEYRSLNLDLDEYMKKISKKLGEITYRTLQEQFTKVNFRAFMQGSKEARDAVLNISAALELFGRKETETYQKLRERVLDPSMKRAVDLASVMTRLGRDAKDVAGDMVMGFIPGVGSAVGVGTIKGAVRGGVAGTLAEGAWNAGKVWADNDTTGIARDLPKEVKWAAKFSRIDDDQQMGELYRYYNGLHYFQSLDKLRNPIGHSGKINELKNSTLWLGMDNYSTDTNDSAKLEESRFLATDYSLYGQAKNPLMRGAGAVQQIAYSGLSDADIWDLYPLTGKVDDFQKATTDALKTVKGDLDLINLNGWSLMSDNISDTSIKFDTEFKTSSDSALSTVSTGLTAVNTGYGAVNTAATSLFNLTGTGFGNSLLATQNYQTSGLAPLALGFGTTLPTQLGLFQTSHDTTFNQAEGKTSAAYTKMGLAAHDFFDDVGFQASHVLGGLVTGHTRSSNII